MRLDMTEICKEISTDIDQEEFGAGEIRVNLDQHVPDIEPEERPKIIDLFQRIGMGILGDQLVVVEDNSTNALISYDVIHLECGSEPFQTDDGYYCAVCEKEERSLMDY